MSQQFRFLFGAMGRFFFIGTDHGSQYQLTLY